MQWLPPFAVDGGQWRLPLADRSAAALAAALVTGDRAWLAEAIANDSALALWGVISSSRIGQSCRTVAALADWMSANLPAALSDHAAVEPIPPKVVAQFDALHMAGVAMAKSARLLAMETHPQIAEEAFLLGLLHSTWRWLRLSAIGIPASAEACLPDWLRHGLQELERPLAQAPGSAIACVCQAISERKPDKVEAAATSAYVTAPLLPLLAEKLARLAELEQSFQETLEREKLEAMAEFAAGAGHEINNPIAVIAGRAQLFLRHEQDPERRRELAMMNAQALRVYEMIADMMLFARPPQPRPSPCDASELVNQLLAELAPKAAERQTRLERVGPCEPLPLVADAAQLAVALRAVGDNALQAIGQGGRIEIGARAMEAGVEITIRDDGPGIAPEIRRHLFDPYFSGRGAGRGLGLGLSKCWRIVTNHGGKITVDSEPGRGAQFTITLPVAAPKE